MRTPLPAGLLVLLLALSASVDARNKEKDDGPKFKKTVKTSVLTASLCGADGDDVLEACEINSQGVVIYGGEHSGTGIIVLFDGKTGEKLAEQRPRLGKIRDIALGDDDSVYITDGSTTLKLSSDCSQVLWSGPGGKRIDVSSEGDVFVLSKHSTMRLGPDGRQVTSWDRGGKDLCVDRKGKRVLIGSTVGGRSKKSGNPVFIPRVYAYDFDGKSLYNMWYYNATEVDEANQMADSRVSHLYYAPNGKVYLLGDSEGGNSPFRMDPHDKTKKLSKEVLGGTAFNDTWRVFRSVKIAFVARVDPADGTVERGSFFYGRQTNPDKNRLEVGWTLGRGIAADELGNVFVTGRICCEPQRTPDAVHKTIGPQTCKDRWGNPGHPGEAFLAIFTPDLKHLQFCSGFAQGETDAYDSTGYGVAGRGGLAAMCGVVKQPEGSDPGKAPETTYLTDEAAQRAYGGGKDGYYVLLGESRPQQQTVAQKEEKSTSEPAAKSRSSAPKPAPGLVWMPQNKDHLSGYRSRCASRDYTSADSELQGLNGKLKGDRIDDGVRFLRYALRAAQAMKSAIVTTAGPSKRAPVFVETFRSRGHIVGADQAKLTVAAMGQRAELDWSSITDSSFARAYLALKGEGKAELWNAGVFAIFAQDDDLLDEILRKLAPLDSASSTKLAQLARHYMP